MDAHARIIDANRRFLSLDIDELVERGVLEKRGSWYRVIDEDRTPEVFKQFATAVTGDDGTVRYNMNVEADRRLARVVYRMLAGKSLE